MTVPLVQIELLKTIRKHRECFLVHIGFELLVFCSPSGLELGKKRDEMVPPTKREEEKGGACCQKKEKGMRRVHPEKKEEMERGCIP